jgi:hypothetical protein
MFPFDAKPATRTEKRLTWFAPKADIPDFASVEFARVDAF